MTEAMKRLVDQKLEEYFGNLGRHQRIVSQKIKKALVKKSAGTHRE